MDFSQTHLIRMALNEDFDDLTAFLDQHWIRRNLIFVKNPDFFRYEHFYETSGNFIIARNKQNNAIEATLGFIKYTEPFDDSDIFTVLWRSVGRAFLGIELYNVLRKHVKYRSISTVGMKADSISTYTHMGFKTGTLNHYFILNDTITTFNIAVVNTEHKKPHFKENPQHKLIEIEDIRSFERIFDINRYKARRPFKDLWYIGRRYFQHPVYKYKVYGIEKSTGVDSVIITRENRLNNSAALRIVDFIGIDADIAGITDSLYRVMYERQYEYVDFYQYGIDGAILEAAGFTLNPLTDDLIIPNYFEPFVQKNGKTLHFFTSEHGQFYIFKGDGDQDRPNV